jgi:hypothetical protein
MPSSHALDRTEITFDDTHAVANAGLLMTATLAERLGLQALVDETVDLGDRPGAVRPGRKANDAGGPPWWRAGTRSTTPTCFAPARPGRSFPTE